MPRFHKKSKSPLWKAGSMLPESTTTIGEGESVATERPFHSMKAVERTRAKLRTWVSACRGLPKVESMLTTTVLEYARSALLRDNWYHLKPKEKEARTCWSSSSSYQGAGSACKCSKQTQLNHPLTITKFRVLLGLMNAIWESLCIIMRYLTKLNAKTHQAVRESGTSHGHLKAFSLHWVVGLILKHILRGA